MTGMGMGINHGSGPPTGGENNSSLNAKASRGVKKLTGTSASKIPQLIVSYKAIVQGVIWKPGDRFIYRPKPPTNTLLDNFVGREAIAAILGTGVYFRTSIRKWNESSVVLMLPAALNPTWEMLWREGREVTLEVIIEGGES